jgi:hypothetical protein
MITRIVSSVPDVTGTFNESPAPSQNIRHCVIWLSGNFHVMATLFLPADTLAATTWSGTGIFIWLSFFLHPAVLQKQISHSSHVSFINNCH